MSIYSNPTPTFRPHLRRTVFTSSGLFNFSLGNGVHIAVVDTGVNDDVRVDDRIDLTETNPYDSIVPQTHGTRVAAIIRHFAKNARITSIKCNTAREGAWNKMVEGIELAIEKGANIINLSMGGQHSHPNCVGDCNACRQISDIVDATGIIIVAAAGNSGPSEGTVSSPGMVPSIVTVGLLNPEGLEVDYISSRGVVGLKKPNVVTSGYVTRYNIEDFGTSFAAPVITGVLANAMSVYNYNTSALIDALYRSCVPLRNVPPHYQGHGVLDLSKFVKEVEKDVAIVGQSQGQVPS